MSVSSLTSLSPPCATFTQLDLHVSALSHLSALALCHFHPYLHVTLSMPSLTFSVLALCHFHAVRSTCQCPLSPSLPSPCATFTHIDLHVTLSVPSFTFSVFALCHFHTVRSTCQCPLSPSLPSPCATFTGIDLYVSALSHLLCPRLVPKHGRPRTQVVCPGNMPSPFAATTRTEAHTRAL